MRMVSAAPVNPNEEAIERALRPKLLADYIGQAKARGQSAEGKNPLRKPGQTPQKGSAD